jgi:hypothetical protein
VFGIIRICHLAETYVLRSGANGSQLWCATATLAASVSTGYLASRVMDFALIRGRCRGRHD